MLGRVGLEEDVLQRYPHEFSGGQRRRVAVMRAGQFVETGSAEQMLSEPAHAYTRELLLAVPDLPRV